LQMEPAQKVIDGLYTRWAELEERVGDPRMVG
jgi:hypothetical protein